MGTFYNSANTRLINYLHMEELTLEDFTVLNPELIIYIRKLGKKSKEALLDWLEENNYQAGKWDGKEKGMSWYEALRYYKEHRLELRKKYPPMTIEKVKGKTEEKQEDKPTENDWEEYRKATAKEILMLMLQKEYPDPTRAANMAVGYTDALIGELKKVH